jgi:hypothetical protein
MGCMIYIFIIIVFGALGFVIDDAISKARGKKDMYDPEAQEETNRILRS